MTVAEGVPGVFAMAFVAVRDRLQLLVALTAAGPALISAVVALMVVASLVPAATAVALAVLIERVDGAAATELTTVATAPLIMFAGVLLAGHVVDVVRQPLFFLVRMRATMRTGRARQAGRDQ